MFRDRICHACGRTEEKTPSCTACHGKGYEVVTSCPRRLVAADPMVGWVVDLAEMARKGAWPVAGGVLDQAETFLSAARLVWSEESRCRATLRLPPHG